MAASVVVRKTEFLGLQWF